MARHRERENSHSGFMAGISGEYLNAPTVERTTAQQEKAVMEERSSREKREKDLQIAQSYLKPDLSIGLDMQELVSKVPGFKIELDGCGNPVELFYKKYSEDLAVLTEVFDLIFWTSGWPDEQFKKHQIIRTIGDKSIQYNSPFDLIQSMLLTGKGLRNTRLSGHSLFIALDSEKIPRTPSHKYNPTQHSFRVVGMLNTHFFQDQTINRTEENPQGINMEVAWARINAFMHDLGKLFISVGDERQMHARISALLAESVYKNYLKQQLTANRIKFVRAKGNSQQDSIPDEEKICNEAQDRAKVVYYHHLLEIIEKGIISTKDGLDLLGSLNVFKHVAALTVADRLSLGGDRSMFALMVLAKLSLMYAMMGSSGQKNIGRSAEKTHTNFIFESFSRVMDEVKGLADLGITIGGMFHSFLSKLAVETDGEIAITTDDLTDILAADKNAALEYLQIAGIL